MKTRYTVEDLNGDLLVLYVDHETYYMLGFIRYKDEPNYKEFDYDRQTTIVELGSIDLFRQINAKYINDHYYKNTFDDYREMLYITSVLGKECN